MTLRTIQSLPIILMTMLLSFAWSDSRSQDYGIDETVKFINDRLDGKCALFAEKKNLRVEFYLNGEPARIDYIFPASIDFEEGIYYSESEGAVIISCYEKAGKCIERDIIKRDTKLLYDRTNLTTECDDNCDALEKAAKHLIKLYVLEDYELTEPFD